MLDVVVHGAGPAGCLAALAVRRQGGTVAVVEAAISSRVDFAETAAPEFAWALGEIGLGDRWREWAGKVPVAMFSSVWRSAVAERVDTSLLPHGPHQFVMRSDLTDLLRKWATEDGITIAAVSAGAKGGLEIDATGRSASIARRRGAARREISRMIALLGTAGVRSRDATVFVEAVADGWCFAAPGRGDQTSVGFYTNRVQPGGCPAQATKLTEELRQSRHIGRRIDPISVRFDATVLASSSYLEPVAGRDWLAMGDAAFASDPLSGSGLTFAADSALAAARLAVSGDRAAYEHFVARRVARFRIDRQRIYAAAASRFDSTFWRVQAAL